MEQTSYYEDIIQLIDNHVQKISRSNWSKDSCPPVFFVSLDNENENNQKILITISHLGMCFTKTMFPRNNTYYGYDSIEDLMKNMYNQTM